MVTKINKNVMLVQDIPSNLIEEVILILKSEDKKIKNKTKEILMLEAKEIIDDCSAKLQKEREEIRKIEREIENKKRRQKANMMAISGFALFTIAVILLCLMIK